MREVKFSLTEYASEWRNNPKLHLLSGAAIRDEPDKMQPGFVQLVEQIRAELAAVKGRTEREQQAYSEKLNRAILGYEEERAQILAMIYDSLARKRLADVPLPSKHYNSLAEAVFAEIIGLSVLEVILRNKDGLEEIQVVGKRIFEVRGGEAHLSSLQFQSEKDVERIQQNLVLFNNDTLNRRKKWAEVSLIDGSRVTLTGFGFTAEPTLTLRLFTAERLTLDVMCRSDLGTISLEMLHIIRCIINSGFNMVVTGPTNSGKTTLIKAMIGEMPDHERLITIESRFELMLKRDFPNKNIIEYEIDEEDRLHSGNQAFKLALRQSPKRICHAEIRDEDANIYVRACTRGHEGSVTTVHVNELEDAPDAIADMCMLDRRGMDPLRLTRRITEYVTQIGLEMGIVDGTRKVVRIGEYAWRDGNVLVHEWVRYDHMAKSWKYPGKLSDKAKQRIQKYDGQGYRELLQQGLIVS